MNKDVFRYVADERGQLLSLIGPKTHPVMSSRTSTSKIRRKSFRNKASTGDKDPASDMTHVFGKPLARTGGEKFPKSTRRWLEKEQFLKKCNLCI